jgi:hypothetical protein
MFRIQANGCANVSLVGGASCLRALRFYGSARESEKGVILRGFLKDDELGPGCGHALGFEQEVTEISIAAAAA